MKKIATFLFVLTGATATFTSTTQAEPLTEDCFVLVGGNYCYPTGSENAASASAAQHQYAPHIPNPAYTRPLPTTTTTTESPVPMECFVLVGGNYCHPVGSEAAANAAAQEAAYTAGSPIPIVTTTTTIPSTATVSSTAVRGDVVANTCYVTDFGGSGTLSDAAPCHRDSWNGPIHITASDGTVYQYDQICVVNEFGGTDCSEKQGAPATQESAPSPLRESAAPPVQELPATGTNLVLAVLALSLIGIGGIMRGMSRIPD